MVIWVYEFYINKNDEIWLSMFSLILIGYEWFDFSFVKGCGKLKFCNIWERLYDIYSIFKCLIILFNLRYDYERFRVFFNIECNNIFSLNLIVLFF